MSDVLPCPFCGKPPYVAEEIDPDEWWYVACQTPGCILPTAAGHTSIESAIAKWNRRAPASEGEQK
ncbi:Lar family restriction alleviation protein [Burkholderia multivorans]|uniref:Lar family restriction alleviation protein n=1 Tax=Burkholderia multivorans TaxID=87883 RepID=A0AAP2MS11_9BURK|nr:Lar family restriction alleviation protein [Burkholderia multivorans]